MIRRVLVTAGIAMLAYVGTTAGYAGLSQWQAARTFARALEAPDASPAPAGETLLQEGDVVGRLDIARLGLSVMILQGVEDDTLKVGAGHVPGTPLPGVEGNVAIAAHRDTFFRPLRNIQRGDAILMTTAKGTFTYVVDTTETVALEETRVLESRARSELTLITCFPFSFVGSAPNRFIVHASPAPASARATLSE